jgi:hypothetical protein
MTQSKAETGEWKVKGNAARLQNACVTNAHASANTRANTVPRPGRSKAMEVGSAMNARICQHPNKELCVKGARAARETAR